MEYQVTQDGKGNVLLMLDAVEPIEMPHKEAERLGNALRREGFKADVFDTTPGRKWRGFLVILFAIFMVLTYGIAIVYFLANLSNPQVAKPGELVVVLVSLFITAGSFIFGSLYWRAVNVLGVFSMFLAAGAFYASVSGFDLREWLPFL